MAVLVNGNPPCVVFEDDHLLVANKPAGVNTHAPSPFAGEGLYDWLRQREPRWASLAIIHRLDKETSGVMVFGKSPAANRSLTEQFSSRSVHKQYLLLTDRPVAQQELRVVSTLTRAGERYHSLPWREGKERAETVFTVLEKQGRNTLVAAEPLTGRTHQIRAQAAERGFPILGDTLYGGTMAARVCLHATSLRFAHPVTGQPLHFDRPVDFAADPRLALRTALIDPSQTDACRLVHGAADGHPGWFVDRFGNFLLSQSEEAMTPERLKVLERLIAQLGAEGKGAYHKRLLRQIRGKDTAETSPQLVLGTAAPERFAIRENGVQFEMSFAEGYSPGLFLDQRDNRRRLLTRYVAANFPLPAGGALLNTFAYTCGFSVCGALGGYQTVSLDLSQKYLGWGKQNFALNQLSLEGHDFIYGDAFDWMRRLAKKGRAFDLIILDPPTFSQSKERGMFRAEKDYGQLLATALPLLKPEGVVLASTNAAGLEPEHFLAQLDAAIREGKRELSQRHYVPQPLDFPITRQQPAYLKTVWLRIR